MPPKGQVTRTCWLCEGLGVVTLSTCVDVAELRDSPLISPALKRHRIHYVHGRRPKTGKPAVRATCSGCAWSSEWYTFMTTAVRNANRHIASLNERIDK